MKALKCLFLLSVLGPFLFADTTRPLLPLPSSASMLAPPADPNHFMFAVGGDNRAAGRDIPAPPTAVEIFTELRLLRPAFGFWTGDAIYGSDDTIGEAGAEYDAFLATVAKGEFSLFNAPGNHEISGRKDLEALYEARMGRLYGSFDYGNSHFIALDTEEIGGKPGIGDAQRDWLKQDLEANGHAANIFVFMHHPLFPKVKNAGWWDPANRDDIHRLFAAHGVTCVFSGHEHLYYRSVHDGVIYVVTGGGGAPSGMDPEQGGFQHYLLVYVNDNKVSIAVLATVPRSRAAVVSIAPPRK